MSGVNFCGNPKAPKSEPRDLALNALMPALNFKIDFWLLGLALLIWLAAWLFFQLIRKTEKEYAGGAIKKAQETDSAWKEDDLLRRMADLFFKFQEAWGHFDIYALKSCATENFYRLLIMEMGALKRRQRQNFALIPQIKSIKILLAKDDADNEKDMVVAEIVARMDDVLIDTENSNMLFAKYDYFCQYWVFRRENDIWKIEAIRSDKERLAVAENAIKGFARRNGFFYDPEFGRVAIPNRGALFGKTDFGKSSADYHVIGALCGKIVQFYTYNAKLSGRARFMAGSDEKRRMLENLDNPYGDAGCASLPLPASFSSGYIVAQVILPLNYQDVLLRKKGFLDLAPRGLKRCRSQEEGFDRYLSLYADPRDDVDSFLAVARPVLQKMLELPFDLNIEIVGSFLYLYAKCRGGATYETMLDLLTLILDEMKSA